MNDRDLIAITMLPAIYTGYFTDCRALKQVHKTNTGGRNWRWKRIGWPMP